MQHSTSIATLWAVTVLTSSTVWAQGTLWELQFGSAGADHANALARDLTGGVYVAGETWGDLAGSNAGQTDPWLARYDASGAETWSRQFGSSGFEGISFAAEDSAGGVFVGGGRCDAQCSGLDAWLARFDGVESTRYCSPAVPNSTGASAVIGAVGSNSASAADLSLVVHGLPVRSFGYLLGSETQGLSQPGNSQGALCLSGNIGRFLNQVIQGPTETIQVDLTSVPGSPPSAVVPGDTWYFQCWFRDQNPTSTSNLTDGLCVRFR